MTPMLAFCMPYYKNPGMLAQQYQVWSEYPEALKAQIEIVLVDDGSPSPAVDVPRPEGLPALRIYRVLEDRLWHQHGARNLAAKEAAAPWLFLTDMDHVLPAKSLEALLGRLNYDVVYTFHRLDAPRMTPTLNDRGQEKLHVNTFAMPRAYFWKVGGYDEDCVGYGTDSYFRRRLFAERRPVHLADVPVIRYAREVIPDASTCEAGVDPRVLRNRGRRVVETRTRLEDKRRRGETAPLVLDFPWMRVI